MMTNPLRAWLQRRYEAPSLFEGVELPPGATCLEVGCGWGMGVLLIAERFPGCRVIATDYHPEMIGRAQAVLAEPPRWAESIRRETIELGVTDATALPFPGASFDAAFAFGILHHIRAWPQAVREVYRVLKPGGAFSCEEVFIDTPPFRAYAALLERLGIPPLYMVIYEREFKQIFEEVGFRFDTYQRWAGLGVGCFAVTGKGQNSKGEQCSVTGGQNVTTRRFV